MSESYKNLSNYDTYFKDLRLIENGEFVDESVSNRPTLDAQDNVGFLGSFVSTVGGSCLGAWDKQITYQKGDIVSYGTSYFKSLIFDNLGNTPKTLTDSVNYIDSNWKCIGSSNPIGGEGFARNPSILNNEGDPQITTRVSSLPQYSNTPLELVNGKFLCDFSTDALKSYTFIRVSSLMSIDGLYKLMIRWDSGVTSYVEFRVKYSGLSCNSSGVRVPEILIGSCWVSSYTLKSADTYYDRYGLYGLSIISSQNKDGTVSVYISTKEDSLISVSGDYKIEPIMDEMKFNNSYFYVNHLVRPFGGDLARDEIGKIYNKSMLTLNSSKDAWDCGMIYIGNGVTLIGNIFSLYQLKLAYKNSGPMANEYVDVNPVAGSYLVCF